MTDQVTPLLDAVLAGRLRREYLLPVSSPPHLNQPGGNLGYAAASYLLWGGKPGLVARVNKTFPADWLERFELAGADIAGIRQVPEAIDDRFFVTYTTEMQPKHDNPISWFAERGKPFPQELLGYSPTIPIYCSKSDYRPDSIRVTDIPQSYLDATAAHICPIDFISHKILPSVLKGGMVSTLTMRACTCYMDPIFWEEIRALITDLTAFMMTDTQALKLFQGRSVDLWEIARILTQYGPEYILINTKDGTLMVYSRLKKKRWLIPAYSGKAENPTGMMDAFDAGFLAGYRKEYDVVQAALCGMVSASFCAEGSGPFYLLECLPGLKEARFKVLSQQVMEV
ncbi:MAG: carbohydrate kinase family protein [Anaerolineaceae bacterium]|nr:carbohydrate kinase family protein [Anaerolineaceae bacterium]MDD4042749.1 carbohydrate kinase family protein [Anaerolineaceae bacterium]MDD4577844.1 carbohydrate kinase family protein [Anaerolineaceae bacterium]